MTKGFGLQKPGLQLRPAPVRRVAIAHAAKKQSALGAQQVLEETQESSVRQATDSQEAYSHTIAALDPATAAAFADRRASNAEASTSSAAPDVPPPPPKKPGRGRPTKKSLQEASEQQQLLLKQQPMETVFIGEVPGYGWSEGFLPQFRTEKRPIEPLKKRRGRKKKSEIEAENELLASRDDQEDVPEELEIYLIDLGVPKAQVQELMDTAVAWRVTPGGRPLIDRRRQSRLARNVRIVAEYLEVECGVPDGPQGVAAVFLQVPELMLCKPTSNDRWDRRAVELAAYRLKQGHCNVPENWEPNVELGTWVKRQRVARAAGQLSEERLQILERMGFEFGDLAQITEEWELRFDQLIDWMLWHGENGQVFSWVGVDWGARGGVTARELALWMALQREFKRRQLLPAEAEHRFEALHVQWEAGEEEEAAAVEWMGWLGQLLYVVERRCLDTLRPPTKLFGKRADYEEGSNGDYGEDQDSSSSSMNNSNGNGSNGASSAAAGAAAAAAHVSKKAGRGTPAAGRAMRARLAATMQARREALMKEPPTEEPGLSFWVARQWWLWRQGALPAENARMLHLAGVDMDVYSPIEWQSIAHTAAEVIQGSAITLGTKQGAVVKTPPSIKVAAVPHSSSQNEEDDVETEVETTTSQQDLEQQQQQQQHQYIRLSGSPRLRVRRWVQTQRALYAEGRLSPGQLRYMQFLDISWILSDEVILMKQDVWAEYLAELTREKMATDTNTPTLASSSSSSSSSSCLPFSARLLEWLEHQRGLNAIGMLSPSRRKALEDLQIGWQFQRPGDWAEWDLRLSQLLVQSIEEGNVDVSPTNERFTGLSEWLKMQKELAAMGKMASGKAAQLKALGVPIVLNS
ncbi:hypothetical protein NADE_003088 [Nannochloris sp. 'desiccata']|nr:hypothetical protein KSW81_000857 [Chlorella desiccata (nom. nud.)]KAH7620466.1 hypothetical protein NADE_003088 [Chlorella desiccata (nom. nud.)]